jgi:hypothetical protein
MAEYPFHYDMPSVRISDSEIVVQKQCLAMIARLFPHTRVAAVPNGSKRTIWQQQQAKREGVSAGFPDLILVGSNKVFHAPWGSSVNELEVTPAPLVAFPEIKAKAPMSTEQKEWLVFMMECGHNCGVFRSDVTLEAAMRKWGFR